MLNELQLRVYKKIQSISGVVYGLQDEGELSRAAKDDLLSTLSEVLAYFQEAFDQDKKESGDK